MKAFCVDYTQHFNSHTKQTPRGYAFDGIKRKPKSTTYKTDARETGACGRTTKKSTAACKDWVEAQVHCKQNKLSCQSQPFGIRGDIHKARKPGRIQLSFMLSGLLKNLSV